MSGNNLNLKQLLAQLRKGAGLAPPTPDEADAAMADPEVASFDDDRLLRIADAVVKGKPAKLSNGTSLPLPWTEVDELTAAEREQFVLNRNRGDLDEDTKKQVEDAEQKALSDDQKPDDEDGLDGEGDPS